VSEVGMTHFSSSYSSVGVSKLARVLVGSFKGLGLVRPFYVYERHCTN
jgi:hypothetical protein